MALPDTGPAGPARASRHLQERLAWPAAAAVIAGMSLGSWFLVFRFVRPLFG